VQNPVPGEKKGCAYIGVYSTRRYRYKTTEVLVIPKSRIRDRTRGVTEGPRTSSLGPEGTSPKGKNSLINEFLPKAPRHADPKPGPKGHWNRPPQPRPRRVTRGPRTAGPRPRRGVVPFGKNSLINAFLQKGTMVPFGKNSLINAFLQKGTTPRGPQAWPKRALEPPPQTRPRRVTRGPRTAGPGPRRGVEPLAKTH